jgi:hypothetical protein
MSLTQSSATRRTGLRARTALCLLAMLAAVSACKDSGGSVGEQQPEPPSQVQPDLVDPGPLSPLQPPVVEPGPTSQPPVAEPEEGEPGLSEEGDGENENGAGQGENENEPDENEGGGNEP